MSSSLSPEGPAEKMKIRPLSNRDSILKLTETITIGSKEGDSSHKIEQASRALKMLQKDIFNVNWDAVNKDSLIDIVEGGKDEANNSLSESMSTTSEVRSAHTERSNSFVNEIEVTDLSELPPFNNSTVKEVFQPSKRMVDEYGFLIKTPSTLSTQSDTTFTLKKKSKSSIFFRSNNKEKEKLWIRILENFDYYQEKRPKKLKRLCREGVPTSLRGKVWYALGNAKKYRKEGLFNELLQKPEIPMYEIIERDISRCYPDHVMFVDAEGDGQRHLFNVLKAYAQYDPELGYCQGMGRLAGMMLMHMNAEDSFWLLVATLDQHCKHFYSPDMLEIRINAVVVGLLLKAKMKKLFNHLSRNDVEPVIYATPWLLTLFTMTLPWDGVLRVWDLLYSEGSKILYRISLAILHQVKDHILRKCPTITDILEFILHIPAHYLETESLLKVAFDMYIQRKAIVKLHDRVKREKLYEGGPK